MSENKKTGEDSVASDAQEVNFKYRKSNLFRVIHVNGVIGGITGRGEIHFGFYNERLEFPDSGKAVASGGGLGPEQIEGGGSFVREIETDAVVDLVTAKQIRAWLDRQIALMESLIKQSQQEIADHAKELTIPQG
jgi:hypothetical protein